MVDGLIGNQDANRHIDKNGPACPTGNICVDFYVPDVTEQHPGVAIHTAEPAQPIPEPTTLALLGLALAALAGLGGRGAAVQHRSTDVDHPRWRRWGVAGIWRQPPDHGSRVQRADRS